LIAAVILSASEKAPFLHLLFEAVSAFGTVGLSTGITPSLSFTGKYVIIFLMFLGRLGPLTFIAASAARKTVSGITVTYPSAEIQIG
ncbi:MAG: potassium transporter, partial [Spirochaetales bacterium]|nr:potassium transporter [Spirochaetales bacterium]